MGKTKIVILAVCAVVAIGGAVAAVPVLRNRNHADTVPVSESISETEPTSNYEIPTYYVDGTDLTDAAQQVTDENGAVVTAPTAADNSVLTTIQNIASTIATTARGNTPAVTKQGTTRAAASTKAGTTKANNTTTKKNGTTAQSGFVQNAIGEGAEQSFLGYRYSPDGYYYCDDKDCWQKGVGYNEVYDKWAPIAGMHIDQVRIRFQYDKKNFMIQFWKGQYGFLLIGAEIGIYECGLDQYQGNTGDLNHFYCADKEDWLKMQLDCYYSEGGKGPYTRIFTRPYDTYWWATGFVKGQLTKYTAPRTELKTRNRITFKTEEQANIFVQGLKVAGFRRASASDQLVDDSYFCAGKDVWVLWSSIIHDCFVGYGSEAKSF